eukprot:709374-Amphidinium_carterae.1
MHNSGSARGDSMDSLLAKQGNVFKREGSISIQGLTALLLQEGSKSPSVIQDRLRGICKGMRGRKEMNAEDRVLICVIYDPSIQIPVNKRYRLSIM